MAAEENNLNETTGTGGTATGKGGRGRSKSTAEGGQQISGEQIFSTTEEGTGGESFATTAAGGGASTGGGTTGGGTGGGGDQANLADAVSGVASGDTGKASDLLNQAKSATGQVASQTLGQVQEKASTLVDTKTSDMAQGLTSVADSLRQATESLRGAGEQTPIAQTAARYGDTVVTQVEQLANYLDRADLNQLTRDVERFARRNPAAFIGGAFALGILTARFVKSSQQRAASTGGRAGTMSLQTGTTGAGANLGATGTGATGGGSLSNFDTSTGAGATDPGTSTI